MILQISEDVTRVGIRIKSWRNQRYTDDWRHLQLVISPGQHGEHCCCEGGSPWIVYGCWPGHQTGVDLMNPPSPDFPAFIIEAEGMDKGMTVFPLPDRWRQTVPFGRYSGLVRYQPDNYLPVNILQWIQQKQHDKPMSWDFLDPGCCLPPEPPCPQPVKLPPQRMCILAEFDIDYGPRCTEHIMDKVAIDLETYEE